MVDGVAELVCAAEFADDFIDVAVIGNWPDFQHVGQRKLQFAVGGVFFQQVIQNFAGFRGEEFEKRSFLLLYAVRALATGEQRCVEGQMTQHIEWGGIRLARLCRDGLKINPAIRKLLDDVGTLPDISPTDAQVIRAGAKCPHFFGSVIRELDDTELLAIGVEFMDEFGDNFHLAAVVIEFSTLRRWRVADNRAAGRFVNFTTFIFRHFGREDFGAFDFAVFVNFLLCGEGGIAVEGRISKVARGRAGVVEDVEPKFAVIVPNPRAAPDDLLEFDHRIDQPQEHDIPAGRRIEACGEQLRGGEDNWRARFHVLKPLHVAAPNVALIGGDAADVIRELLHQIGIEIVERSPHLGSVFLVNAENDGLGETVSFLEEIR